MANYSMILSPLSAKFMQAEIGPNFRGQLLRLFPDSAQAVMVVSLVILLSAALLIFLATRRWRNANNWLEMGTLLSMPLGLLTSLHCHDYDLILLTPSIVVLCKYRQKFETFKWLLVPCALVGASFVLPIYLEIHYAYLLRGAVFNPYFFGLLIFAISVFVLARTNAEKLEI